MIADDDAWASGGKILFTLDDLERDASGEAHGVFESTGGKVLGDAVLLKRPEEERDEHAVGGAEDESGIGDEETGVEGCGRETHSREGEEGGGKADIEDQEAEE